MGKLWREGNIHSLSKSMGKDTPLYETDDVIVARCLSGFFMCAKNSTMHFRSIIKAIFIML